MQVLQQSDECLKYSTIEERKKQLKDGCHKCLNVGHVSKDCKRSKTFVYCGEINAHHRNLCPQKFNMRVSSAQLSGEISELLVVVKLFSFPLMK